MNEDEIDNHQELFDASRELEYLSKSLFIVGNETLAEKLATIAENVHNANINIRDDAATDLNQRFVDSQEATANMVNAALAGILSEKENKENNESNNNNGAR